MRLLDALLARRRLVLALACLLSLAGAVAWLTMVRQEDPTMPSFWGQVVVSFPGADARMVERQLVKPIEDALAEVAAVDTIRSTAFAETAVLAIDLDERTTDTTAAWDKVREALDKARLELPQGASEPVLDDSLSGDHESVVLGLTGAADPLELLNAARTLRSDLLDLPQVAKVKLIADPGEEVVVELDDAAARRLGLTAPALAAQLASRTQIIPGGSLGLGQRTVRLRPLSEVGSVAELAASSVRLPSGQSVPLGEVARVRMSPSEPAASRMRLDGELAVGLGVVAKDGADLVRFGAAVRACIEETAPSLAPVAVKIVTFQPRRVEARLDQLGRSLLLGILIVAGVVILAMGLRLGLVVSSVVPMVAMAGLALYAMGGGVLHQISIAALVLALGMLVDNAIVIAENVQWRLDRGAPPREAAVEAVRELAVPLGAATLTTMAAFVPMLLAEGATANFTSAIPVVVMLTLGISYLFAVLVTPVLSEMALVPGTSRAVTLTATLSRNLSRLATRRTVWVIAAAALMVAASLVASGSLRRQFFPTSDRNQLLVDVRLPEGAHLDATDAAARVLERGLLDRPEVVRVASFMGRGAPKFYYNIPRVPWSPHFAQLMVETTTTEAVGDTVEWLPGFARTALPGITVIARELEQGPPVEAPVEVRLFSTDLDDLAGSAAQVARTLRELPGTADVRYDLGPGEPQLVLTIDDAAAARRNLGRADVARALYGHTRGLKVGELRTDEDPIPIVVRSSAGERTAAETLATLDVAALGVAPTPLGQVARIATVWRPAAIHHYNRRRLATVSAQLSQGYTFSDVMKELEAKRADLDLPAGVKIAYGGDAEGSGEANTALLRALPIGMLLLMGVLLAEFNSFRSLAIILTTVPLAATGVIPGLLLAGQPFGFMSLLGIFALVGVVVNNAIVLLEVVDSRRRAGADLDAALADAVAQRIRPILLTTATTVAGLLPLAFSHTTLWPPLAWAMISGLLASTVLTLVVVPALYRLLMGPARLRPRGASRRAVAAITGGLLLLLVPAVRAGEPLRITIHEAMQRALERPAAVAAAERARAAAEAGRAERRTVLLPTVGALAEAADRDRELELETPMGGFPFGASSTNNAALEIVQPLLDPARLFYANPATHAETAVARLQAERTRQKLAAEAAGAVLDVLKTDARLDATRAFARSLTARLQEMEARVAAGRALEADALKIRLALEQARQDELALTERHEVALAVLAHAVGLPGAVEAVRGPDLAVRPAPELETAVREALERRPDLRALVSVREALELRRAAVRAELLPRVDARVAWTWSSGSAYVQSSWVEGAVRLRWSPFAAGTRGPRAAALAARRAAASADLEDARRGIAVEVRAALAAIVTARGALGVGERGVEQARESLRVERERHASGRATTNDLLEAEARLRDKRTQRDLARLAITRAWLKLWLAIGGAISLA